jgi:hypothetical protein
VNRLLSFDFLLPSIFLVTAIETRISIASEIALRDIWLFAKETKSFGFRITVSLTAIYYS